MNDDDWAELVKAHGPTEPRADIRTAARGLREFYLAFVDEGFTRAQAMTLVMHAMTNGRK